jgi:hypothetical protein
MAASSGASATQLSAEIEGEGKISACRTPESAASSHADLGIERTRRV